MNSPENNNVSDEELEKILGIPNPEHINPGELMKKLNEKQPNLSEEEKDTKDTQEN